MTGREQASEGVPITFLVFDAYGGGGVARTFVTVANHLARRHPVRVISFRRGHRKPRYALDPSITVSVINDPHRAVGRIERRLASLLAGRPSRLRPTPSRKTMTLRTDLLLRRALRKVRTGVVISTRPSLHLAATAFTRRGVRTIGWDHLNFPARVRDPDQLAVLLAAIPRLDAWVVLTERDADDYRRALPDATTRMQVIHNAVDWPADAPRAELDAPVVVAAGRLEHNKGFVRLIPAFGPVARRHPDWQLHIYGKGKLRKALLEQIEAKGLTGRVQLRGYTRDIPGVFAQSSVFAMSSRREGFPMVLIEAMNAGLPLVAFDCPRGPAEIVDHGVNGLLVPEGDIKGLTRALLRVIEDAELRKAMGAQALVDARSYTTAAILHDWETLVDQVVTTPPPPIRQRFARASTRGDRRRIEEGGH